jgi:hypothetical protein
MPLPYFILSGIPTPVQNWLGNEPATVVYDDIYKQGPKDPSIKSPSGHGLVSSAGSGSSGHLDIVGGVVAIAIILVIVGLIIYAFIISPFMNVKLVSDLKDSLKGNLTTEEKEKMQNLKWSSYLGFGAGFVLLTIILWFGFDWNNWKRAKRVDNKKIFNLIDNPDQEYISEITFTRNPTPNVIFKSEYSTTEINTDKLYPSGSGGAGFITPSFGIGSDNKNVGSDNNNVDVLK